MSSRLAMSARLRFLDTKDRSPTMARPLTAVRPGVWSGREEHLSFQDIVVAEREAYA